MGLQPHSRQSPKSIRRALRPRQSKLARLGALGHLLRVPRPGRHPDPWPAHVQVEVSLSGRLEWSDGSEEDLPPVLQQRNQTSHYRISGILALPCPMNWAERILRSSQIRWETSSTKDVYNVEVSTDSDLSYSVSLHFPDATAREWFEQIASSPDNGLIDRHSDSDEVLWLAGDLLNEALSAGVEPPVKVGLQRLRNGKLALRRSERPTASHRTSGCGLSWHSTPPL